MRKLLLCISAIGILVSCSSSNTVINSAHPIHELMKTKQIIFEAQSASPMVTSSLNAIADNGLIPSGSTISRIDLNGNTNYLKIFGDSVSADLPFFGERQFGGGYGTDTGIEFNGLPESYSQEFNSNKQKYTIRFQISDTSDLYTIYMEVFPNQNAVVSINMANRNPIRFNGTIKALKEEE
ncbi:DUF4251 domain-containing protein [Maribacter ulvicola]|uniref:DUF4251 domain-containing protein n=1 Tax=Maribacter ulvicola TaxID=228959 RepID=A0A1N6U8Y9_9FLAO|nr:DUF4251 domain-containing protein [Maribacter ulvicola]SIQ62158.1 protein of unknown function [Maribacter ulvicola]